MNYRVNKLREELNNLNIDGILISSPSNRRYISNFTGSAGHLLITKNNSYLFTDGRYIVQAENESSGFKIINEEGQFFTKLNNIIKESTIKCLAFEENFVVYSFYNSLKDKINNCRLKPVSGIIEKIRAEKSRQEIEYIKKACNIGDKVFTETIKYIKNNKELKLTEKNIENFMEHRIRELGGISSFTMVIVSGERGALPHGGATERGIKEGELITIDFGVIVEGYRSDMTRTISIGEPNDKRLIEIYNVVKEAQKIGVEGSLVNVLCEDVDILCREYIDKCGYGKYFVHGTGHGVGLDGHECEILKKNSYQILKNNSVITVEPGIYIEGFGGVRIEDTIVVTNDGPIVLTKSTKELIKV